MPLFADPLHDEFAAWATGYITTGGADYGEIVAIAEAFPDGGDDAAFYDAWAGAASRHEELADDAERAGHLFSARGHLLRAAAFYGVAIHVVYGKPVDPRMLSGFNKLTAAFERSLLLASPPAERLTVEFDGYHLPTWFVPAVVSEPGKPRPLVIVINGYDATMADAYLGLGKAASERGYHVVLFDGPGQGALLVNEGIAMVSEWERVVSAVVDAVIDRDDVDQDRIALHGWSLGGHLAPRAATGEHRLAAVVADPALWGVLDGMRGLVGALGFPELADDLPELPDDAAAKMTEIISNNRGLEWKLIKRGFWVNGADDLRGYLQAVEPFTLTGRAAEIRCPVLGTAAEGDPLASGAKDLLDRLSCPTTLLSFTAAQGAGGHCEMQNRWALNSKVLDWLDDTLA
jgi:alpha-beta hydrolase superfamily lysophospholipase